MVGKLTSRKDITSLLPDNCIGAEIGVQRGFFSYDLCESGKFSKFYSIDSWEDKWEDVRFFSNNTSNTKIPDEEFKDWVNDFGGWEDNNEVYQIACNRLSKFEFNEVIRLKSVEAANLFDDETFDFIYIDSSHNLDTVTHDLKTWLPKVKKGGILAGDDYIDKCDYYNFNQGRQVRCVIEVKSAVDNFFDKVNILEIEKGASQWYVIK
jgi:hypothetical protein